MRLLLRTVAVLLREENQALSFASLRDAADALGGALPPVKALCDVVFDDISPVEYFTAALLAPFLYEFAFDADGVDDNAGTLEGYAVNNNRANAANRFKAVMNKLVLYFTMSFRLLAKAAGKLIGR